MKWYSEVITRCTEELSDPRNKWLLEGLMDCKLLLVDKPENHVVYKTSELPKYRGTLNLKHSQCFIECADGVLSTMDGDDGEVKAAIVGIVVTTPKQNEYDLMVVLLNKKGSLILANPKEWGSQGDISEIVLKSIQQYLDGPHHYEDPPATIIM